MYCTVSVRTDAKKESIERIGDSRFHIAVREPAERNLANGRVRELIALHFKVPVGKVRILGGHRSPSKLLSIDIS